IQWRAGDGRVIRGIDRGTAGKQRVGLRRTAVVGKWTKQRVHICDVVRGRTRKAGSRSISDQIVVLRVESTIQIGDGAVTCVVGSNCVLEVCSAHVVDAAGVATYCAVGESNGSGRVVQDAAAAAYSIVTAHRAIDQSYY